jgi:GT2 family glycosyltransferase
VTNWRGSCAGTYRGRPIRDALSTQPVGVRADRGSAIKVTVIFLLYNASETTAALVDAISAQKHPHFDTQFEWLDVVFMDDRSSDDTLDELEQALSRIGKPSNYHVEMNPTNLGLAGTLNKAFGLVRTEYALTCHLDCFFGSETYVADMLDLIDRHPEAGAIAGQPTLPLEEIGFAEKINLISNLMPILPVRENAELAPIGFAEGRCDIFRIDTLKAVGFYDTALRVAGEDQVLAGKIRDAGFEIYRAGRLKYFLRASTEQNSIGKLLKHVFRFGKVHPFILLRERRTAAGVVGTRAGGNLQARTLLRLWQVVSVAAYVASLAAVVVGASFGVVLLAVGVALGGKLIILARHLRFVSPKPHETLVLLAVQPLFDIAYVAGLLLGGWLMLVGSRERPIT